MSVPVKVRCVLIPALLALAATRVVLAQEPTGPAPKPSPTPQEDSRPFHLGGEFKVNFRNSKDVSSPVYFPFPPELIPQGQTGVIMRTVDPGSSLELQTIISSSPRAPIADRK